MHNIGIMQGRLVPPTQGRFQSFPRDRWADEFALAEQAGLDCIEWIYDEFGADVNPLATDDGVKQMLDLSAKHGVTVRSCCADYFMDWPLVRVEGVERTRRLEKLNWLLDRCKLIGITRIVLPFVDISKIETEKDKADVADALKHAWPAAERNGVEIHLETALGPAEFAEFLERCKHPLLRANYDSGNSSSLGYNVREEFAAYGRHIGSIHVKDRIKGGGTVPLGTGDADLPALFECMAQVHYAGDIVLQVARGEPGGEVDLARKNRAFVMDHLKRL